MAAYGSLWQLMLMHLYAWDSGLLQAGFRWFELAYRSRKERVLGMTHLHGLHADETAPSYAEMSIPSGAY
jgi:hypothetical protein